MLRLTREQRAVLVETVPEFANLVSGGLVLGWFLGPAPASAWLLVFGLVSWVGFVGVAILIAGGKR